MNSLLSVCPFIHLYPFVSRETSYQLGTLLAMKTYKDYDVIVVGGGHAGCEAALAAARMGAQTLLLTMSIPTIAQMSCNPAIGGLAKGHLVREIDALGGAMGGVIDRTGIQFRVLNRSKGPAVWSLRAQADRALYSAEMRRELDNQTGLDVKQLTVTDIIVKNDRAQGVITQGGGRIRGKAVILTAGTFLNGLIHIGLNSFPAGRMGEFPALGLTDNLVKLGFRAGRLKTGTPPRVDGRTIAFDRMKPQNGDEDPLPFSYKTDHIDQLQVPCYITFTNPKTHRILESGLDRSPLYTGRIKGAGPRYCPSVEVKIVRFPDRERHQIFLEPEGFNTEEYYVNGFATSLPEDVQIRALRTVAGLEGVEVTRLGYAIEYDFFPPSQIKENLETKMVQNLFFAGQINGTSGYEEAAAQGLMAGINAAQKIKGKRPFVLRRDEAYIGVLIDDLITKEIEEPYRMFTSRAEYRLLLRSDNADSRLMGYGRKLGLVGESAYQDFLKREGIVADILKALRGTKAEPEVINPLLVSKGSAPIPTKEPLSDLLKRPGVGIEDVTGMLEGLSLSDGFRADVLRKAEQLVKYEGYIKRQRAEVAKFKRWERMRIPRDFDFAAVKSLSAEARECLSRLRPISLGQASRIAGVRQADLSVLMITLKKLRGVSRETSTVNSSSV